MAVLNVSLKQPSNNPVTPSAKTPYQQVFSQPVQQEWKVGDKPNNYGQALATINEMYKTNPTGAMEKLNLLNQYRTQPGNKWFDPYSVATNNVIGELKSYGIDPAELNDDWFKSNTSWQGYLSYNGTTTTPSKPGKKATAQEKAAYALYQFQGSMGTTNAAKNEWAAAQDELGYWANRKDLNLSDDDIISKVFGSGKYSTLKKMDDSRTTGKPLELNEAIDYNPDSVRGVIWAARNGGGTGNSRQDIANYYSKVGNGWTANEDISEKLNKADLSTYSPHEIGMTGKDMDEVGAYFGVGSFAPGEIEAMRSKVDWDDATSVKMWQKAYGFEQDTLEAEKELAEFNRQFERRLNRGFADQNAADKWIEDQLSSGDFKTLAKMDSGIQKGDPMNLTRAVPYRKQMYQNLAAEAIANPKKSGTEIMDSYGMPVSDADKSTTKVENENVGSAIDAMGSFLSKGEKDYFDAVPGVDYAQIAAGFNSIADGVKSGMIDITNNATKYATEANGKYNKTWLGSLASRNQYERYQATAERLAAEVGAFEQQNGTQILASENIESEPVFSLDDGTQVQLIYDDETGEYEIGNVWNDMWRFDQPSTELLTAAEARAEEIRIEQNSRANNIRTAQSETGEMDADTVNGIEEYNKKKEQLAALNDYLDANKAGYEQSIHDAETAKANRDALGEIAAKAMGIEYDPTTADSIMQYAGGWYDYVSPPFDGITLVEESAGKSNEDIKAEIDANNANVQDLQFVLSMLGDNAPEDLKHKINQAISDAEKQNRVYGDYMITSDPRFDYLAKNGQLSLHYDEHDEPQEGISKIWFPIMTDEEKRIYFALVSRDGIDKADEFYKDIQGELEQRRKNQIEGDAQRMAESGWLGRLASEIGVVLVDEINTLAGAAYTAGVFFGGDEGELSALKIISHASQSVHNANIAEIKKVYGDPVTGEETALSKVFTTLYEIGYNRGRSMVNAATWGAFMPHISAKGKIAEVVNSVISATPIALSAASDALANAIDRNATPEQQAIIFASTLIAESWTEGIEFGHIEKAGKLLMTKEGFMQFLKSYPSEAFSEVIGESMNDIIENIAGDVWAKRIENPDYESEHEAAVKKYMAEDDTLTPEQAEAKVRQDEIAGVLHTAVISALSPGADVLSMAGNTIKTYNQYVQEARAYNNSLQPQVRQNLSKSIRDIRLEHEAAEEARNNPQPVATETVSETASPATQPEAEAPVNEYETHAAQMDTYDTNIILLEEASNANATAQAAAIASAINTGNTYMAQAAAAKLDFFTTQGVMIAGRSLGIDPQIISTGLQLGALGNGACAELLNTGIENGLGTYGIAEGLASAVNADMQNEAVAQGVSAGIHDARVNEEFKRLMAGLKTTSESTPTNAGEAMERLSAKTAVDAMEAVDNARNETKTAEAVLEIKQNELTVAQQGVSDAAAAVANDPVNDGNQMTAALSKMVAASAVVQEYTQKLEKARERQKAIEDKNMKLIEETTAGLRQEAENTVSQQEAVEAEQARVAAEQAQAEAQARAEAERAEQMSRNITTLQTEEFVEKYYPDATDEQKEDIAQRIDYMKQQTSAEAILDRAQFVKSLSNKFGTKIRVADTTEGGKKTRSNAYVDVNTGEIVVDHNSTMSDILYAVLPHELMHLAEKSGNYKALADTLLQIKYGKGITYDSVLQTANGGDRSGAMATAVADLLARKTLYDERLGSAHTNEYALQETVADLMGGLFRSGENGGVNADLVNRLVAEEPSVAKRIMNAIKSFIRKMAGFNDPALTQAQMAVDMLNAALKERTASTTTKKQNNQTQQRTYVSVENALGAGGWKVESNWARDFSSDNGDSHYTVYDKNGNDVASVTARGKTVYFSPNINLNKEQASQVRDAIGQSLANAGYQSNSDGSFRFSLGETTIASDDNGEPLATELPGGTVTKDSLSSWTPEEITKVKKNLKKNGFTDDQIQKWVDDVNSVAAVIAADQDRLDFIPDLDQQFKKPNGDVYKWTLDASTLCAKRLLYQGTFNAIQKALPNVPLRPGDLIELANMMHEMGYQTPCGICYVESRRRHLGNFTEEFLADYNGEHKPTYAELTSTDGLAKLKKEHRQAYDDYIAAMNGKGVASPKVVQLRTNYRGDVRNLRADSIKYLKDIGGLRIQSFSDFETPHLMDMMQAVLDMAAVKLTSQAYTKVPNFAWVFGDTGIKINLSLMGEGTGVDENGNLIFSNTEGMDFDEAMRLRDRYSKNVGTILVGMNDAHIIAAMGDDRIDFIIPFHKSGWSEEELSKMKALENYTDYQNTQNELWITGQKEDGSYITASIDKKTGNLDPYGENGYWEYDKTGRENAEKYLRLCAEQKRLPKFSQFLVDNGDGSFSLPQGDDTRSTNIREGYWKTLIDFKMYDNEGVGAPQEEVTPNINMEEAYRVLAEYEAPEGGNNALPVADPVVEEYVKWYKSEHPEMEETVRYSLPSGEEENAIYIKDGHTDSGETIDFISKILDGDKGGETRTHNRLTRKWVGLAKDGNVYGRVRFGDPYLITKDSPEYKSAMIEGTEYDINDGESKYYYPVIEKEDFRGNPRPIIKNGNYGRYRYSLPSPEILDQQIQNFFNQRYSLSKPLEGKKGPSSSDAGTAERAFGGGMLQESEMDTFAKEVVREYGRYFPDTNLDQIKRAVLWVRSNKLTKDSDGLTESMQKVSDNKFDYRSADGQARMVALMAIAVAKGDTAAQTVLADAFNRQGTDLGRALQARKLFRMMTPQGRIATIDKMLKDEQARLEQKGVKVDLKFSDWVYMAAAAATEEGDFTKVRQMAAEELADQLPANWKDRIRAIRMLSMLGNPRTHIRNIIGNALFVPAVSLKNKMGAAAEMLAGVEQGERTKTLRLRVDKDIREFAEWDAKQHKDDLTGDSRWNERDIVRREQKLFKGKFAWLQSLSDFNSSLLEKEDWHFLRNHYTRALGGWMQANGYTVEQIKSHPELLEKGRTYALNEAQKATYRDFNAVANKLNQLSRQGGPVGFIVDAALPFKKTPANILKRGIEYSPIGLAKSLSADLYNWKKGNVTTNQLIDDICSGLTGTGILMMGALLSSLGIVTVGMDDDDDRFETERGGQKYAVNLGKLLGIKIDGQDVTYTMDWAAPMSMPFFVGAAVMNQLQEEKDGYTFEDFLNDSSAIAEPVFNLSMLEGVNSLFETSKSEETNSLTQIGAKIISNYATSYVPSLLGGITRAFDPVRRKSFVKSGESSGPMGTFRYAWEQTENKIPGLSQTNIPYRNAFGEADESSFLEKAFENFISPGYVSVTRNDPVIEELERLYGSSDVSDERKTALVPKLPNKAVGGTALEPDQYDAITVQRGQTAKNLMSELMKTDYYKNASDEDRAIMMADVWTYATQTAQNDTVGRKLDTWVLNSRTNPVQSIINRSKKTIVSETQSGWKAEAVQAVKAEDYDALDVCIEGLKDAGVKDAKSSVKSAISSEYKSQYITAYQLGRYDELMAIEDLLENTGLFRQSDFEKWLDTMNAQISDEEI